ncbi:MAG: efflux RND transporter permease subunit [bacterium]
MRFINLFVHRPVFTAMLFLALMVLGIISVFNLPYELLPDITKPEISIVTMYSGASPEIVEREVTTRIEEAVYGIKGVMDVKSVSTEGKSLVTVYFHRSSDVDASLLQLREKLDAAYWSFPDQAERPNIMTTGPSSQPIMGIWVKGDRDLISEVVTRRLEQLEGVSEARIIGLTDKQIRVTINPELTDAYGISPEEIKQTLESYNISMPIGMVREGSYSFPIRFVVSTQEVDQVKNLPLQQGRYLIGDIAVVEEVEGEQTSSIYYNGEKGYFIEIYREWNTNAVRVSDRVSGIIEELKGDYPDLEFQVTFDDAKFIIQSIKEIIFSLIIGGLLAFIALFMFTGNRRVPLILAVSMPLSIVPAFFCFYLGKISVNTMTLAGLALAVGMLVDASIVVLENIIKVKDAVRGASEVVLAVTTSIITTMAVFFPVIYIHGIAGMMLKPLSLSVIITLAFSLLVAFTILPLLSQGIKGSGETRFNRWMNNIYGKFSDWFYHHKIMVYFYSVIFLAVGVLIFWLIPKEALPTTRTELILEYELPFNTSIPETEKIGLRLTEYFNRKGADCLLEVGETDPFGLAHTGNGAIRIKGYPGKPDLDEIFKDYQDIQYSLRDHNPVLAVFTSMGEVSLRGFYETPGEGEVVLEMMKDKLNSAVFNYTEKIPVINIYPRHRIMSQLEISTDQILSRIQMFTEGEQVVEVERGEEIVSISLTAQGGIDQLQQLTVQNIPLSFITEIKQEQVSRGIVRFNGKRCIEAVIPYTSNLNIPQFPFKLELGGEVKEYQQAQLSALFAFGVAVFLVYLILASFYESFRLPLLIMIAVPFAASGFMLSLIITGTTLNIISLIGLVVLVGIVVNDSIVLVDRAEYLRKQGDVMPGKIAARNRLRPIIMTTITTVLGLLPFSLGNTLHAPLGRGIIGGLIFSTFITLVLIPVVYDRIFSK